MARGCQDVLSSTTALCDHCSSVFSCTAGHSSVGGVCLSLLRKDMHSRFAFFARLMQGQACDVEQEKDDTSSSAAFITETNQVLWSLLTNTVPHGQTIMYMVTPANEASMMAAGYFSKIFDLVKNGLQLTDDSVMMLKNEFASNDLNIILSYDPFQDDDMERLVEMCALETYLLHNVNMKFTLLGTRAYSWHPTTCGRYGNS